MSWSLASIRLTFTPDFATSDGFTAEHRFTTPGNFKLSPGKPEEIHVMHISVSRGRASFGTGSFNFDIIQYKITFASRNLRIQKDISMEC